MFQQLIASRPHPHTSQLAGSGGAAVAAHMVCIAVAVWATLRPQAPAQAAQAPVLIMWPSEPLHRDPGAPPVPAPPPLEEPGGWSVNAPPIGLPPIDVGIPFHPSEWLHASAAAATPAVSGDAGEAASVTSVEQPPVLLAARRPAYPPLLLAAGITGRVVVQAVVDTSGRAEPGSVTVIASDHPGFDAAARSYVLGALFRPGRTHGRAVRVQVRVPIIFALAPAKN
jgi:TonB family protein